RRVSRRRSNANRRRPLVRARARRRRVRAEPRAVFAAGELTATRAAVFATGSSAVAPMPAPARAPRLEEPDAVGGPVSGERFADDPRGGDRSPEPAVVGFATVVPHHEPVTGWNLDRDREVALRAAFALADIGVFLRFAVASDVTFVNRDDVTGASHDALDEVHARVLFRLWFHTGLATQPDCMRDRSTLLLLSA